MKKLIITAALMSVFTLANANLAGASINGKQVRKGQSYGEVVAAAGQPVSHYDYVKNVGGKDVSVRELSYVDGSKTFTVVIEDGKVTTIRSGR
ncbi:hypothetical protein B9T36_00560 [Acinetobacter sp. ANC 4204]|jgi:hypothetical protein|uniref:DUF2845 domain-containing protein n=1 Tax=Acinetobacter sp. ANC 4204 TaxID=1977884 RepID=UPI000A347AE0|nr:DUF2845 domain-containing protein [Acinetobacter sp. ANC 4204]OTG60942.1 hypothetical protein B9T36_00560 [Acinetobacter sp. ANC 4204]